MKHELKIWPQYFCRVKDGSKTFEVQDNDRGFQPGDTVILREFDPRKPWEPECYTEATPLEFKIGYVFVIDAKRVVFSLLSPTTTTEGE